MGAWGGNLYCTRNWRSILAARSVGLDCEAQFRPITDKRASAKRMRNRDRTFVRPPLMLDLSANYLTASLWLSTDPPRNASKEISVCLLFAALSQKGNSHH